MAFRVELSARAVRNLRGIHGTVAAGGGRQAAEWFDRLLLAITTLRENPGRCPQTPEDHTARHLLFGRGRFVCRVIFDIDDAGHVVNVLHVRHGSQQPLDYTEGETST